MDAPLDARSQEIFDSVPPDEPRSCLEPYKALILRLHDGGARTAEFNRYWPKSVEPQWPTARFTNSFRGAPGPASQ
jgi:hypothetical protein